jgi:hypothetical protein
VVVLVDSLVALVIELLRDGRASEAVERLRTRMGCWTVAGHGAEMHLLDTARLRQAFEGAGLRDVAVTGLLQAAATLGRERLDQQLAHDWDGHLKLERELSAHPVLADIGKQLLASGAKR